jgi:TPR repeat protein
LRIADMGRAAIIKCKAIALLLALAATEALAQSPLGVSNTELNEAVLAYAAGHDREALRRLHVLAAQDSPVAQFLLARLYLYSPVIPRDCKSGVQWAERSAVNGNSEAAYEVGNLYSRGHCVEKNESRAVTAYLRSGALGLPDGLRAAAELRLKSGAGDIAEAIAWLRQSAESLDALSCYHLGMIHLEGRAGMVDPVEAYKWFDAAAYFSSPSTSDYDLAIAARDRIREFMTPAEVRTVRLEADDMKRLLIEQSGPRKRR